MTKFLFQLKGVQTPSKRPLKAESKGIHIPVKVEPRTNRIHIPHKPQVQNLISQHQVSILKDLKLTTQLTFILKHQFLNGKLLLNVKLQGNI